MCNKIMRVRGLIKYFSLAIFLFSVLFLFNFSEAFAQTPSADVIAIRIENNSDHLSPMRWYLEKKNFTGSPERIQIDGYEAIRDGRTVYVAAANVSDPVIPSSNIYTNIYLISYNDKADNNTVSVFDRLLKNWKFNSNLLTSSEIGLCIDFETKNTTGRNCYTNSDCSYESYCNSTKAGVVRDTKRYADLTDLAGMIQDYYNKNGIYPKVDAGSYLSNRTISTWRSWQLTLGSELGAELPVDPSNDIGDCGGSNYNSDTCWDEEAKQYAGSNEYNNFDLPALCSRAYLYKGHHAGLNYKLCANFDTTFNLFPVPMDNVYSNCGTGGVETENTAPVFISQERLLNAHVDEDYIAYVSAFDADRDALNWSILDDGGFTGIKIDQTVSNYHKRISIPASSISSEGRYEIKLQINDGSGWVPSGGKVFVINVFNL